MIRFCGYEVEHLRIDESGKPISFKTWNKVPRQIWSDQDNSILYYPYKKRFEFPFYSNRWRFRH